MKRQQELKTNKTDKIRKLIKLSSLQGEREALKQINHQLHNSPSPKEKTAQSCCLTTHPKFSGLWQQSCGSGAWAGLKEDGLALLQLISAALSWGWAGSSKKASVSCLGPHISGVQGPTLCYDASILYADTFSRLSHPPRQLCPCSFSFQQHSLYFQSLCCTLDPQNLLILKLEVCTL